MKKTALIIIDVQRGLFDPTPQPFEAEAVIERLNALSSRARLAGVTVAFVQHERAGSALSHGAPGWLLPETLSAEPGDLRVRKTTPDSFLHTELEAQLRSRGIERLVICGYASEFCVDTTVRRAAALGFEVVLAADAHTTHDKPHASAAQIRAHENATLPQITSFGPRITAEASAGIALVA